MTNDRDMLIQQVKVMGQDIIDRADDIVGNGDLLNILHVWANFSVDSVPTLEVRREYTIRMFEHLN